MTTTNPSVLRALADRCEREEPSWMLTCEIEAAITPGAEIQCVGDGPAFLRIWGVREWRPLPYTTSLDAAVTLVPEMQWGVNWDIEAVHARGFPNDVAICVYVWLDHPTNEKFFVRSPGSATYAEALTWLPRLICAASLRARAALADGDA